MTDGSVRLSSSVGSGVESEALLESLASPEQPVRYCGADCTRCETHVRLLAGDTSGVVNEETGYRCCWLPSSYPEGRDCPIKACCQRRGLDMCGACDEFPRCDLLRPFYAQPGYDALRERVIQLVRERRKDQPDAEIPRETP
jgi:hypothetical protein